MDANKLKRLKEINYTIPIVCGLCKYSDFVPGQMWGTCGKFQYNHLKHTESKRQLSIYRYGSCESGELSIEGLGKLGKFDEFVERK